MLSDEERRAALEELAHRLGKDIPDAVADNLSEADLHIAYATGDEQHWSDVMGDAQRSLNTYHRAPGTSMPPGRGAERGAPEKVAITLPEDVTWRAEALTEVCATLCADHPEVQQFRLEYLGDRLLNDEDARAFLDERGGPDGTDRAARKNTPARKRRFEQQRGLFQTPLDMQLLLRLAEKLSRSYPWEEGDALWFVLTGHAPPIRPLEVTVTVPFLATPGSHVPSTARITITAHAWVGAGEVNRAFSDTQRKLLGGDTRSPRHQRTSEVVKFVARRIREHPKETWDERRKVWNEACREGWRYKTYRGFQQVYNRFMKRYVHREYDRPNFEVRERTPYESYRTDWNDRIITGEIGRARRTSRANQVHQ